MNCTCIKDIEAKVLEKLQSDTNKTGKITEAKMQNMGLSFDDMHSGWNTW